MKFLRFLGSVIAEAAIICAIICVIVVSAMVLTNLDRSPKPCHSPDVETDAGHNLGSLS